jgi:hypothetical protein
MKPATTKLSCEDVLNAFAVEPNHERPTLERYLRDYPQYAVELAHLSHELSRTAVEPGQLSAKDKAVIEEAWKQYSNAASVSTVNVFTALSVPQLRELANRLGVPRQIITAFREQKVIVASIPRRFLARVATALNTNIDQITASLTLPLQTSCIRSHKADEKPIAGAPATFEQLLIDAQVPNDKRAELMAERD